jgi:gamma-glutamylcyclotransferase (GGCT)/AIG2-like uncharacterized protein YtfP
LSRLSCVRLFVYGSLKRDGRHHDELKHATFLGEAQTLPGYALEALGEYLALVPTPDGRGVVRGELFELPETTLEGLDDFEGAAYYRATLRLDAEQSSEFSLALAYLKKAR